MNSLAFTTILAITQLYLPAASASDRTCDRILAWQSAYLSETKATLKAQARDPEYLSEIAKQFPAHADYLQVRIYRGTAIRQKDLSELRAFIEGKNVIASWAYSRRIEEAGEQTLSRPFAVQNELIHEEILNDLDADFRKFGFGQTIGKETSQSASQRYGDMRLIPTSVGSRMTAMGIGYQHYFRLKERFPNETIYRVIFSFRNDRPRGLFHLLKSMNEYLIPSYFSIDDVDEIQLMKDEEDITTTVYPQ